MFIVIYVPVFQPIFHTVAVEPRDWLLILGLSAVPTFLLAGTFFQEKKIVYVIINKVIEISIAFFLQVKKIKRMETNQGACALLNGVTHMVMSMTGFGRSVKQTSDCMVQVEIKTVNHRYREFHIKMPPQLSQAEIPLRNQLSKQFNRGRIELNIKVSGNISPGKELHIDWDLMDSYYHFIKEAKKRYRLAEETVLSDLFRLEEAVIVGETGDIDGDVLSLLLSAADDAAAQVLKMRETEGNSLSIELDSYINSLEELVQKTKELSPLVQKHILTGSEANYMKW